MLRSKLWARSQPARAAERLGVCSAAVRPLVRGEDVRDYLLIPSVHALWPYEEVSLRAIENKQINRILWRFRSGLSQRVAYGQNQIQRGLTWYEYSMFFRNRFKVPLGIGFAFVSAHNHFCFDRGGNVFNRTAPIIKLPPNESVDTHLELLGLLNSSTGGFWMKQVFYPKGGDQVGQEGARVSRTLWEDRYEFTAMGLDKFPPQRTDR